MLIENAKKLMLVCVTGAALLCATVAYAQTATGPRFNPPPSYGPPFNPVMTGYQMSVFTNGFNFSLVVNVSDLQKFLPPGYTAIPSTPGGTTTNVAAIFNYRSMVTLHEQTGSFSPGTYGPFNTFDLAVGALAPPGSPNVFESVFLLRLVDNQEIADLRQAFGGTNETRFGNIDIRVTQGLGGLEIRGRAEDPQYGLKVVATATYADEIAVQLRNFGPIPLRSTDPTTTPVTAGSGGIFTVSSDNSAVSADPTTLNVGAKQVRTANGKLKVLDVLPGNFFYAQEAFFKKQ